MKIPYSWLSEYCDAGVEPRQLAERLAMTGTEVERITVSGPPSPDNFVVGKVLAVERHPDEDRLSVCRVETGDGERTIVCGAPNVAAGQTVAVSLPGAIMPGGQKIRDSKLRGVESNGMILSELELELGAESDGIMVLGDEFAAGQPLSEVVPLAEPVLELEVTPNRIDCLGVYGVAREVHAITGASLKPAPWIDDAEAVGHGSVEEFASITVEVPELCPRFTARVFTDLKVAPSPAWLRARLIASGQRPINNLVDITNYVMLLTAQPLHAFDLDEVPGGALTVRAAADGEKMTTLDDVDRVLDSEMVLVCDDNGPSAIAGIMGGQVSEVSDQTTRVLLEVANWNGPNILQTSRRLALRSEASSRFEKQLHPELCMRAQQIASRLIVGLCDARLVPGTIDVAAEIPAPRILNLRESRVEGLLGMQISQQEQIEYLMRLGFGVEAGEGVLEVTVPPDRSADVTREVDLIEEVARVHGLSENLPITLPASAIGRVGGLSRDQRLRRRAEDVVRDLGFNEVVGFSFVHPEETLKLGVTGDDPRANPVRVSNPLSEDQSVMRTQLIGSLLTSARYNRARGASRVALFESGRVYLRDMVDGAGPLSGDFRGIQSPPAFEPHHLAGLVGGPINPESWRGSGEPAGFFDLKGVLEALAAHLRVSLTFQPGSEPFLHPGRSAEVTLDGASLGYLGELHPRIAATWDIETAVVFEIELGMLARSAGVGEEAFHDIAAFPSVNQDLAVVVPEGVAAASVEAEIGNAGGELLRQVTVFDVYRGDQIGADRKSLALRLEFRADDRTLTEDEVRELRERISNALDGIGGSLRV